MKLEMKLIKFTKNIKKSPNQLSDDELMDLIKSKKCLLIVFDEEERSFIYHPINNISNMEGVFGLNYVLQEVLNEEW